MSFDRQIATARRLITKFGQSVTWKSVLDGTANVSTPWDATEAADQSHIVDICFVPAKDNDWRKLVAYMKGTEVQTGKLAGLMGAVDFEPKLKDVVVRDGAILRISNIDLLSPNGQKILYIIEFEQ